MKTNELSSALDSVPLVGDTFPAVVVRYRPLDRRITVPNVAGVDIFDGYVGLYPGDVTYPTTIHVDEAWLEARKGSTRWHYVIEVGDGPYRRDAIEQAEKVLPSTAEMSGSVPDLTGDMTTAEYLRSIRGGGA